jgi:hypothetical protein
VFRAFGDETPVLIGGRAITGFVPGEGAVQKADLAASGLEEARFHIAVQVPELARDSAAPVEIETGNSNYRKNIEKALQAGFERVLCLATSKPVENRIAETLQNLKQADQGKVSLACLTDETYQSS